MSNHEKAVKERIPGLQVANKMKKSFVFMHDSGDQIGDLHGCEQVDINEMKFTRLQIKNWT